MLVNTIVSYSRTVVSAILILFSNRWVLAALGFSDYGIYQLVGSLIVIVTFLNAVLSGGASRFFSIAMGESKEEVNNWFNVSLLVHFFLFLFVVSIGILLGPFVIKHYLSIPAERVADAILVFKISLITASFSVLAVPYNAMYLARQSIVELSLIQIFQSLCIFCVGYTVQFYSGDKLLWYAIMMCIATSMSYGIQIVRAGLSFSECRFSRIKLFRVDYIKALFKYSFWNLIGDLGHLVRTQGVSVVANLYWGTIGNSTWGIANQVANQSANLTNSLSYSMSPQINKLFGAKDYNGANKLADLATCIGMVLILLLSVPMICEVDYIFDLWLVDVPPNAGNLCILLMIMYIIEKLTMGNLIILKASNNIAWAHTGVLLSCCLSLLFCIILHSKGIVSVGFSCCLGMAISRICILACSIYYNRVCLRTWLSKILLPSVTISAIAFIVAYLIKGFLPSSLVRLVIILIVNTLVVALLSIFLYFDKSERQLIVSFIAHEKRDHIK